MADTPTVPDPRKTTLNADNNGQDGHGEALGDPPEYRTPATISHDREWHSLFEWARKRGVLLPLLALTKATACTRYRYQPQLAIGTLLRTAGSPWARRRLELWEGGWPAAKTLFELSVSLINEKQVRDRYPAAPGEATAREQLGGDLITGYLLALLVESLPELEPDTLEWHKTLRVWVVCHAVERAFEGVKRDIKGFCLDANLREVANGLRLANSGKHKNDWRQLIAKLRIPDASPEVFESRLREKADALLRTESETLKTVERTFLRALQKIADHEHYPFETGDADPGSPVPEYKVRDNEPVLGILEFLRAADVDDEETYHRYSGSDDGESDLVAFRTDPSDTILEQNVLSSTVVLHSIEEIQYLPWSWGRPSPVEQQVLDQWVEDNLGSSEEKTAFLATLIAVSKVVGRSFRNLQALLICSDPGIEWSLMKNGQAMVRAPARRIPGWAPADEVQSAWVNPIATKIELPLTEQIRVPIQKRLSAANHARCVADLWDPSWGNPESELRLMLQKVVSRVTPGMLGNILSGFLFKKAGDATLVSLLLSRNGTGLTGACSYPSWSSDEVAQTLGNLSAGTFQNLRDNVLGSRLDPIEELLRQEIRLATQKIAVFRVEDDPIRFHNAFTIYLVTALLAATGARPIRDPFESWNHFNFEGAYVFVDDKSSDYRPQGRLVPIPLRLSLYIRDEYARHLSLLAGVISDHNSQLAVEIGQLSSNAKCTRLPLFFLLSKEADDLKWDSISPSMIERWGLWTWPLPANLFRHRLASSLRRAGIDPELIDALNGHSELGSATHGDHSFRTWSDDMHSLYPVLDALFDSVGFELISSWAVAAPKLTFRKAALAPELSERVFGARARRIDRRARIRNAMRMAKEATDNFLAGRNLSDLSPEEFDKLSLKMLLNDKGLPHPMGALRYRYLMRRAEKLGQDGHHVKIKRRYDQIQFTKSPFKHSACLASVAYATIRSQCDLITGRLVVSRLSIRDCRIYGAIALCIYNRVAAETVLQDVCAGVHYRLVAFDGLGYLEWSPDLEAQDMRTAVKRMVLPEIVAKLLDRASSARYQPKLGDTIPRELEPIAKAVDDYLGCGRGLNLSCLFKGLVEIVDQFNVTTMPGVLAAFQAGRIDSYALGWADWIRLKTGVLVQTAGAGPNGSLITADGADTALHKMPRSATRHKKSELQIAASKLAGNVKKTLAEKSIRDAGTPADRTCDEKLIRCIEEEIKKNNKDGASMLSRKNREKVYREIRQVIEVDKALVSSSMYALCEWAASLLWRRKGHKTFVALSTVARYFGALSPSFSGVGYQFDLLTADQDDLTEFYSAVLLCRSVENPKYVFDRLWEFHKWAAERYGLENPDWSELPVPNAHISVSPGFISEDEYLQAFTLLVNLPKTNYGNEGNTAAVLLLLVYRFGLRAGEALGLTWEDWRELNGQFAVLVRNNRVRRLKTPMSRRQTPAVFLLTDEELASVERRQLAVQSVHGVDPRTTVFSDIATTLGVAEAVRVKKLVLWALKRTTSNPRATLHHARHSAANRVGMGILDVAPSFWKSQSLLAPADVQSLLLGRTGVTRRSGWAIARYLGHTRIRTTVGHYLHFFCEWSDSIVHATGVNPYRLGLKTATNLDNLQVLEVASAELSCAPPDDVDPIVSDVLRMLRLVSYGKPVILAASAIGMAVDVAEECIRWIESLSVKLRMCGVDEQDNGRGQYPKAALFDHISDSAWRRLIKYAREIEAEAVNNRSTISESWRDIFGASRQIVLWKEQHFKIVREALNYFKVGEVRYRMYRSSQAGGQTIKRANSAGFAPKPTVKIEQKQKQKQKPEQKPKNKQEPNKKLERHRPQLDSAYEGEEKYRVESRCALIFDENDSYDIRNSIEFVTLLSAYCLCRATLRR